MFNLWPITPERLLFLIVFGTQVPLFLLLVWLRSRKVKPKRMRRYILGYCLAVLSFAGLVLAAIVIGTEPTDQEDAIFRLRRMGWEVTDSSSVADLFDILALDSGDASVSQEALEQLARVEHADLLTIRDPSFSDEDLKALARRVAPNAFDRLALETPDVTAEGLLELKRLAGIRSLSLEWMTIGSEEVAALGELNSLESLDVSGAEISDENLHRLRQTMPEGTIVR